MTEAYTMAVPSGRSGEIGYGELIIGTPQVRKRLNYVGGKDFFFVDETWFNVHRAINRGGHGKWINDLVGVGRDLEITGIRTELSQEAMSRIEGELKDV